MPLHHLAFATRDLEVTHRFYTEAMGFDLIKVEAGKTPSGGWAKHVFYGIGSGECIAFWDLHDDTIPEDFSPAISKGLGLPMWVNHVAFKAADLADLEARKKRWLEHGLTVSEVDHRWCVSIYAVDPNRILVEFCTNTRELTDEDRAEAHRLLRDPSPPLATPPPTQVFRPDGKTSTEG
jgi:catechol 2,3-dioxygenase-like lactoylglutathione lyase family enzyme